MGQLCFVRHRGFFPAGVLRTRKRRLSGSLGSHSPRTVALPVQKLESPTAPRRPFIDSSNHISHSPDVLPLRERRRSIRYTSSLPTRIHTKTKSDRIGVSRNLSCVGVHHGHQKRNGVATECEGSQTPRHVRSRADDPVAQQPRPDQDARCAAQSSVLLCLCASPLRARRPRATAPRRVGAMAGPSTRRPAGPPERPGLQTLQLAHPTSMLGAWIARAAVPEWRAAGSDAGTSAGDAGIYAPCYAPDECQQGLSCITAVQQPAHGQCTHDCVSDDECESSPSGNQVGCHPQAKICLSLCGVYGGECPPRARLHRPRVLPRNLERAGDEGPRGTLCRRRRVPWRSRVRRGGEHLGLLRAAVHDQRGLSRRGAGLRRSVHQRLRNVQLLHVLLRHDGGRRPLPWRSRVRSQRDLQIAHRQSRPKARRFGVSRGERGALPRASTRWGPRWPS